MNRLFSVLVAVCVLCAFTVDAQAKVGMKVGAGISFGSTTFFNAHMSKDISAFGEYSISPFADVFLRSGNVFAGGVNGVQYSGEGDNRIYWGGGGGLFRSTNSNIEESMPPYGTVRGRVSSTGWFTSTVAGIEFGSIFFCQGRWLYFKSATTSYSLDIDGVPYEGTFSSDSSELGSNLTLQLGVRF